MTKYLYWILGIILATLIISLLVTHPLDFSSWKGFWNKPIIDLKVGELFFIVLIASYIANSK